MILTVGLGALILLAGTALYTRTQLFGGSSACPSCAVPFIAIPQEPRPNYDVLVCAQCANTVTAVHGGPSRFAACPDCHQRTLEVTAVRLPPSVHAPIAVECHELCHVCNYQDVRLLPESGRPVARGLVIPFPTRR